MIGIARARAYCNNEVGYLAWEVEGDDPDFYGFEIARIYLDDGEDHKKGERRVLPAWVPFKGQKNRSWHEQDTSVWPIQSLFWRDLTLRQRRDSLRVRSLGEDGVRIRYEVRAVGKRRAGLPDVPEPAKQTYEGDPVPLSYYTDAITTNELLVTDRYGAIQAAFTNGILSSQWLSRQIDAVLDRDTKRARAKAAAADDAPAEEEGLAKGRLKALKIEIANSASPIRRYLTGDVLGFLKTLLDRAQNEGGQVLLALYELTDEELVEALIAAKAHVRLILSNTSLASDPSVPKGQKAAKIWDVENAPARKRLADEGVDIQNRMFNNGHIGHNKFAVYLDKGGAPRAVLSGSTNWTPNGLCAQSNNAILITDDAVAAAYAAAWQRLYDDKLAEPNEPGAGTDNKQGQALRQANMTPADAAIKGKKGQAASVRIWQSPNTKAATKGKATPPDLDDAFKLIRQAKQAIFFLVFQPSLQGHGSVVEEAVKLGQANGGLLVIGAVSDPSVLPNYIPPVRAKQGEPKPPKPKEPHKFESGDNLSVVQADALFKGDLLGDFEAELKSAGHAIIHDKIVVIDPLLDSCAVITGSHNLGLKASYENDENMLIVKGNKPLAEAYMVHVLDVYDHYWWRASRAEAAEAKAAAQHAAAPRGAPQPWGLELGSGWLARYRKGWKMRQAKYLAARPDVEKGE
jgi:phosphatidylserine/phosphatidylglycerophosphate/cardiolipin synthase-like enzyme